MDRLLQSLEHSSQYPSNLVHHDALKHNLEAYHKRLKDQGDYLFDETQAAVDFLDLVSEHQGSEAVQEFRTNCVTSLLELKYLLRKALKDGHNDPQCRFVFLHAPHSRASLRISYDMLSFLFTYHQVMPSFLDFLFPFGKQVYAQDFHFSGLREENRFDIKRRGDNIPELGRSGSQLQLCYNLRSVEGTRVPKGSSELPWSIRQSAVYHSLDTETGRSVWINVKGNKLLKKRISEASTLSSLSDVQTCSASFSASLDTHLIFCDWSSENWRWYINDLENELQKLTRNALATPVDKRPSPPSSPIPFIESPKRTTSFPTLSRKGTSQFGTSPAVASATFSPTFPSREPTLLGLSSSPTTPQNQCNAWSKASTPKSQDLKRGIHAFYGTVKKSVAQARRWRLFTAPAASSPNDQPEERHQQPPPHGIKLPPLELPRTFSEEQKLDGNFTFSDLQRSQFLEEKAQEVLLVLGLNSEVLEDLKQHYIYATRHPDFSSEIKNNCQADIERFERCISSVKKDLQMLQSRTENLLRLLANRKNLLNGILQYRSVKASESFARKAQVSADNMEQMTWHMHDIAQKTRKETVSMRVITSVTLFFLPATFIATFMSTDILTFEKGTQDVQSKGLKIYLGLTVPITAITFIAWWVIYILARKNPRSGMLPQNAGVDSKV